MMKLVGVFTVIAVMIMCGGIVQASQVRKHAGHQMTEASAGSNHADVVKYNACQYCGMDREKYAHSRMLLTYSDGSSVGVCSINCLVTDLKVNKGKKVKTIEVADLNSKKLIDAEKATWVIGGNKKGVMTQTPKWAFEQKKDAEAFVSKNGGRLSSYKEALALAEEK